MKYKAAIFDMDGTILDTIEDMHDSVNASLRHFGMRPISLEATTAYVGNGAKRLIEQAVPEGTDAGLTEEVLEWYKPYYNDHSCIKTRPYKGIVELLTALKTAGMKLAVVSNKPDMTLQELVKLFFGGVFVSAVGESPSVRRKPWPDAVNAAVDLMAVDKSSCVYIGDSEVDVATAKNAGMDCISVSWGFRSEEQLLDAGAKTIVRSPDELLKKLLGKDIDEEESKAVFGGVKKKLSLECMGDMLGSDGDGKPDLSTVSKLGGLLKK